MSSAHPAELLHFHSRQGRLTLLAAILGSGMAFLDTTAVNVALPAIGDGIGADFAQFQWILNGYFLALASFVLVAGALGDVYGRRTIFLLGVVLFAAASLPCGLAPAPAFLIAARFLQGIGGALLIPTSVAIVQTAFRPEDRGRALGTWAAFSSIFSMIGPLLGGWLVDAVSWRTVFLINPVLATPVVWVAVRYVPRVVPPAGRRPDLPGAASAVVALAGIVYALIEGPERGWDQPAVRIAGLLGLATAALFVAIERRRSDPMLPLGLFRQRAFATANAVTFVLYGVMASTFFLLTLELQRVLGYTALGAGAALAPVSLTLFLVAPRAGALADRAGPRRPLTAGLLVAAVGLALLAGIGPGADYVRRILPGVLVAGVGLGLAVPTVTSAALSALDDRRGGLAAGVNNAMARTAQLIGIPLLPLLAGLSGIDRVAGAAFSEGFSRAMWLAAGALSVAALLAVSLPPGSPSAVRSPRAPA